MSRRLARWSGLVGVALRRTATKATKTAPRQTAVSVLGVAIAVALMLVVTATGLGLVQGTTVRGDAVDYWVVPEGAARPRWSSPPRRPNSVTFTTRAPRSTTTGESSTRPRSKSRC
ncbi:hypothetical protein [Halorussus caseinilyticus]|uniref:Uncharacterized protein n=1 Tax=Halorussus caseinilyticus TaxID=3034025 RepID=A0ABD5WMH7_9EURY